MPSKLPWSQVLSTAVRTALSTDAGDAPLSEPPRYLSFERMEGLAVYSRSTIVVMMEDGTHYEIRGDLSFSALKYLYLYQFVTNKES